MANNVARPRKNWIKINGLSHDRMPDHESLDDIFKWEGAQSFSRKPLRFQAGDRLILFRLAKRDGHPDYCVYGRAEVDVAFRMGIDQLPPEPDGFAPRHVSLKALGMFKTWPYLIWPRNLEIVKGQAYDAPWFSVLNTESQRLVERSRFMKATSINIDDSVCQLLDEALNEAFDIHGRLSSVLPDQVWWNKYLQPRHRFTRKILEDGLGFQGHDPI